MRRTPLLTLLALAIVACRGPAPPPATQAPGPAKRIVTLSPQLAELVYAAGAGSKLVGVVEFSDFPPAVAQLPRVGDAFRVDYEAVAALAPDLVLGWTSGNPPETIGRLRSLGYRVVTLEPERLDDVATHLEEIGALAGTAPAARDAADGFRARLQGLRAGADGARPLRVFVQLSDQPLFTVTDRHFLGQGLALCGGRNVFGELPGLTAIVSLESVIDAAPEVIIASDMAATGGSPLASWRSWTDIPAVRDRHLYALDADLLSRPAVRILDGIEGLCSVLDDARTAPAP